MAALYDDLSPAQQKARDEELKTGLLDFGRGASYFPFDAIGGPVDIVNEGLGLLGMKSEKPFMGSDFLIDAYASIFPFDKPTNSNEELAGRIASGFLSPQAISKSLLKLNMNVSNQINAVRDAKKLRSENTPEGNQMAAVAEAEASPLVAALKRIDDAGQKPVFNVTDDGTYLTVKPVSVNESRAAEVVSKARAKNAGAKGTDDTVSPITKKEIDLIISDPDLNDAYQVANRISMETNGVPYDLNLVMTEAGTDRVASLSKQAAIGRAFSLAAQGSPEYKSSVFSAYGEKYPSLMEAVKAKNYDDLVEKSYRQLGAETQLQFNSLPIQTTYHGGDLDYVTSTGGTNSIGMLRDVIQNQNLNVFRGGDPHDFLNKIDPETGLNMNEQFRAVHDYFGHGPRGSKFDAAGEEMAYGSHSQMFSPLARMAMAAETRGQNSLVNFSPLNVSLEKKINDLTSQIPLAKTDAEKANISRQISELQMQRQYAPQRSVLLPPEMLDASFQGGMPSYLKDANVPLAGTTMPEMSIFHASPRRGLLEIDPSYVGSRMTAENYGSGEASRISSYNRPDRSYFFQDEYSVGDPATKGDPFVYQGTGSNVYDAIEDPAGLLDLARFKRAEAKRQSKYGNVDEGLFAKDFEQAIKDYGYSGYSAPFGNDTRAVQMFYPTQVRGILDD